MAMKAIIETGWVMDMGAEGSDIVGFNILSHKCIACLVGACGGGGLGQACGGSPTQSCNIITSEPIAQN